MKRQKKGFVVIDIRSKDEINKTGSIEGAIKLTAFNKSGQLNKKFLKAYQSLVTNTDNVIFIDSFEIKSHKTKDLNNSLNLYILIDDIETEFNAKFTLEEILEIKNVSYFKSLLKNHGCELNE